MKNPPDFVTYVVMIKKQGSKKFDPVWLALGCGEAELLRSGDFAMGYRRKKDALAEARLYQDSYGKKNVYVQQYGPYS